MSSNTRTRPLCSKVAPLSPSRRRCSAATSTFAPRASTHPDSSSLATFRSPPTLRQMHDVVRAQEIIDDILILLARRRLVPNTPTRRVRRRRRRLIPTARLSTTAHPRAASLAALPDAPPPRRSTTRVDSPVNIEEFCPNARPPPSPRASSTTPHAARGVNVKRLDAPIASSRANHAFSRRFRSNSIGSSRKIRLFPSRSTHRTIPEDAR